MLGKKPEYEKLLIEEAKCIKKCQGIESVIKLEGINQVEVDLKKVQIQFNKYHKAANKNAQPNFKLAQKEE